MIALQRLEVLPLLPSNVVVQERSDAPHQRGVIRHGLWQLVASLRQFSKDSVFAE